MICAHRSDYFDRYINRLIGTRLTELSLRHVRLHVGQCSCRPLNSTCATHDHQDQWSSYWFLSPLIIFQSYHRSSCGILGHAWMSPLLRELLFTAVLLDAYPVIALAAWRLLDWHPSVAMRWAPRQTAPVPPSWYALLRDTACIEITASSITTSIVYGCLRIPVNIMTSATQLECNYNYAERNAFGWGTYRFTD